MEQTVTEIICLGSKVLKTGRPRVLHPGDFKDGSMWEAQVAIAEENPKRYKISYDTIISTEAQVEDLSKVELSKLTGKSREFAASVAAVYGIPDTGQTRSTLIDQIADERRKQTAALEKSK